jgi:hypothetical protein
MACFFGGHRACYDGWMLRGCKQPGLSLCLDDWDMRTLAGAFATHASPVI